MSVAPAAENRSVIRVDMSALLFAASNCRAASFPLSRRVGMMNRGSRRIDITVTCQEIVTMTPTVSARDTKFDTIPDRVFENARWAPMTSVLSRETRAPVRVRLKKAIGIDWTWSYTAVRRSKMRPSPIREDRYLFVIEIAASAMARPPIATASHTTVATGPPPVIALTTSPASTGLSTPMPAVRTERMRKTMSLCLCRVAYAPILR